MMAEFTHCCGTSEIAAVKMRMRMRMSGLSNCAGQDEGRLFFV
jgi:hypothetical protein